MSKTSKTTMNSGAGESKVRGSLVEQMLFLEKKWPGLYDSIDTTRLSEDGHLMMEDVASKLVDFDSISQGGRGELYRLAQEDPLIRSVGIRQLFELVSDGENLENLSPNHKILDVLGGDGVLARAMPQLVPSSSRPAIVTSDISEGMILAALEYGLFAIRQAAQNLLMKDGSLDGVILAYGTHHIPQGQRLLTCQEAFRVLKHGGRIVLHDFETASPVAKWFNDVVDPYSLTGHNVPHFTKEEIRHLLTTAGFADVKVRYMYDPFIFADSSEEDVKRKFATYVFYMYGLVNLADDRRPEATWEIVYDLASKYFRYDYPSMGLDESSRASKIEVYEEDNQWLLVAPRIALVGYGVKH